MLPLPEPDIAVSMMKMEFLRRGSRRWYWISALVFGIAIFIHIPQQVIAAFSHKKDQYTLHV